MSTSTRAGRRNETVIGAIRAHHAQLADQLRARTDAVVAAAGDGDGADERDALHAWYHAELMPHIRAEEQALYGRGADLDATALLVRGMLAEHRSLETLVAELTTAPDPLRVAATAVAAHAVFRVHLDKENDLLLPALDEAGVDLGAALDGMHEVLGGGEEPAGHDDDDGGCGCGCEHGAEGTAAGDDGTVEVTAPSPAAAIELDVRALPHGQRHEIIFGHLDQLTLGASLVIVNDHDPKPLRYQTSAMWPDRFVWSYLEAGPRTWRVAISRAR